VTGGQALGVLLCHLVGDYVCQSHWMATEKVKRWWPAICHAATYTAPWLVLTRSWWALAVIGGTHLLIDRWRLARYVVWAKNLLAPAGHRAPLTPTGYGQYVPEWLAVGLLIVADNTIHLAIAALTLEAVL
jgi:hypothetical protein